MKKSDTADSPVSDIKGLIAAKIAEINAHETLDINRKAHAIQTLKEVQRASADEDFDIQTFTAETLASIDERLSIIAAKEREIKAENAIRENMQPKQPPLPMPRPDITLAQRYYTEHVLKSLAESL